MAALAVLMMSVDCACGGAMKMPIRGAAGPAPVDVMPCCAHHAGVHHCSHASRQRRPGRPCDANCQHCGQSLLDDTVSVAAGSLLGQPHHFGFAGPVIPVIAAVSDLTILASAQHGDSPPLISATTLLRLHCALIG